MRKLIFFATLTIPLMAGIIFTGYWSSTQKLKATQTKVQDTRKDLKAPQQKDANAAVRVVSTAEEWKTIRNESELKIKENEIRITELNAKMKKTGELFDALYQKKIDNLEKENRYLKARLEGFYNSQGN